MSILKVDTINEKTSGNRVQIPGHIIQVQQGIMTARQQIASASMVDVGSNFEVTITPSSTSSKILVQTMLTGIVHRHELVNSQLRRTVGATTTNINLLGWYSYVASTEWAPLSINHNYLDSPNTTSACTYKVQVGTNSSSTYYLNYNNTQIVSGQMDDSRSTITVMEIAQ